MFRLENKSEDVHDKSKIIDMTCVDRILRIWSKDKVDVTVTVSFIFCVQNTTEVMNGDIFVHGDVFIQGVAARARILSLEEQVAKLTARLDALTQ